MDERRFLSLLTARIEKGKTGTVIIFQGKNVPKIGCSGIAPGSSDCTVEGLTVKHLQMIGLQND